MTPFHEPLVLFGLLAGLSRTVQLSTGILISPQRQTALLAKQAAEVDFLSGGRLRLVLATGWNDVEYEALGVDFKARGRIMDEQVELLRQLWTEPAVTYHGEFHTVNAAGINPMPIQRPIPLWFGGTSKPVLRRTGRTGDGWMPHYPFFHEDNIRRDLEVVRQHARDAGRDPDGIGIEAVILFYDDRFELPPGAQLPPKTLDECVTYAHTWKDIGATHYWVTAPWADLGPEETGVRVTGKRWSGIETRLRALEDFRTAVGPEF
jgi:probable F420-dependent oxidoreductase